MTGNDAKGKRARLQLARKLSAEDDKTLNSQRGDCDCFCSVVDL